MPTTNERTPRRYAPSVMVRVAGDTLRGSTERGVDLLEAVKVACARLRIPYDAELVRLAVDHVERTNRA